MSREVHVRFCEQRRGKFPPLTLLLIFVRSRSAAQRVLRTVTRFIESHLALTINRAKSKAARLLSVDYKTLYYKAKRLGL